MLQLPYAVDGDHKIVVAVGVSNQATAAPHLEPMVDQIKANTSQLLETLITDLGFCSTDDIYRREQPRLAAYIPTNRQELGKRPRPSPTISSSCIERSLQEPDGITSSAHDRCLSTENRATPKALHDRRVGKLLCAQRCVTAPRPRNSSLGGAPYSSDGSCIGPR